MSNICFTSFSMLRCFKIKQLEYVFKSVTFRNYGNEMQLVSSESPKLEEFSETDQMYLRSQEKSILAETNEDLSDFNKYLSPTFNFAPYVNESETLKNLVRLGVNLSKIEDNQRTVISIMKLDFETEVKKHLFFLSKYVDHDMLGQFISKHPMILKEDIEDMQTRISYLQSKMFTPLMIKRIVSNNPFWLSFSTKRIDRRLGHFQKEFDLMGHEVRLLTTSLPRLITYSMDHIRLNTFSIKEEMELDKFQVKDLLLRKPRLWMINNKHLMGRFNYILKTMNIPIDMIVKMPEVLLCRTSRLRQRHLFLEKLGRAQYNNTQPNYVSLQGLVSGTDAEFCGKFGKCSVSDFNAYLKTL